MKKNIAMRVAAILFILTMISTCAFSTTFAKYVTSDNTEDSARVAKWGVTVVVAENSDKLFVDSYNETGSVTVNSVEPVAPAAKEDVLAPGTNGGTSKITVAGTPEVMVDVEFVASLTLTGWVCDRDADAGTADAEYCPLVFTVNGVTYGTNDTNATNKYDTIALLEDAVEKAITVHSKDNVAANTSLADSVTVTWAWAFYVDEAHDKADTALGNLATAPTVEFSMGCTVTQVD